MGQLHPCYSLVMLRNTGTALSWVMPRAHGAQAPASHQMLEGNEPALTRFLPPTTVPLPLAASSTGGCYYLGNSSS